MTASISATPASSILTTATTTTTNNNINSTKINNSSNKSIPKLKKADTVRGGMEFPKSSSSNEKSKTDQ